MKFSIHKVLYLLIATLVISVASSGNVIATEKDKSARRAQLMMQKMKQDMEAEKAAMQTQFDAQKKELEDKLKINEEEFNKQLANAERKNKKLEAELNKVNTEKTALETKLQQTQAQLETTQKNLADLTAQHNQALADLKFNDNQRKTLSTNLTQTTKAVNDCEIKNAKLHQFGTELVQLYDKPSNYEAAMRNEKFFQLKRVELENILQNQQDKLDDARFVNKKSVN